MNRSGFTLIELLITLFVTSLVLGAGTVTFILQHRIGSAHGGSQSAQMAGQVTQELLERDLRMAGYRTARPGSLQLLNNVAASDPEARAGTDTIFVAYSTTVGSHYRWFVGKSGGLFRRNTVSGTVEPVAAEIDDLQAATAVIDPASGALAVELFLVARSPKLDPNFSAVPPRPLDSPLRPADSYRRRVFASTIVPRNFGL